MGGITYTQNLGLRISPDLTPDAVYNLQKLDTLAVGGTTLLDASQIVSSVFSTARIPTIPATLGGFGVDISARSGVPNFSTGTPSWLTVGTSASNLVQLTAAAKLPAVDGSLVTNLAVANLSGQVPVANGGTGASTASGAMAALSPQTSKGDLIGFSTLPVRVPAGADGAVLVADSTQTAGVKWSTSAGTGSVTSVGLSLPGIFSVSGSPVTTSGTLSATLATQAANLVWAGPTSGPAAAPGFRALVAADIPAGGNLTSATTGVSVSGGTGAVIGSGASISIQTASGTQPGLLSAADWTTFSGKQAAGNYITALTGDVTASGPGSAAASLVATSNSTLTTLSSLTSAASLATVGTIGTGVWAATAVAETHGGTNQTTYTLGDLLYASGANTLSKLGGNTTSTRNFLRQVGTGTVSAAPGWDTLQAGDIPSLDTSKLTTGTLGVARGGTGVTSSTGTGSVVLSTSPALVTPTLGVASATSLGVTGTAGAGFIDLAEQSAAPSSPAASTLRLYSDTNDALWLKNSAGTASQVGSGAGEKNYLTSGASTSAGWSTSGTVAAATDTTSSDPRPNTTKTALKLTSGAAADYAYTRFTLDDADFSTKLKIQFAQAATVGTDWKVEIYSNTASNYSGTSTRLALSTDSSSVSALPGLTGTYRTTFDAPGSAAKWLELRFVRVANASALYVSDIIVGPGTVVQGAAVSAPITYTPTVTGFGTATFTYAYYMRRGEFLDVYARFTAGTVSASNATIAIPSALTINQSWFSSASAVVGDWIRDNASASTRKRGKLVNTSSTTVTFTSDDYTTASSPFTALTGSGGFASSDVVSLYFSVPINEWAGAGTVNVVQNDNEYYSFDGSQTYGPGGALVPNVAGGTASTLTITTLTPIQATDLPVVEFYSDNAATWNQAPVYDFAVSHGVDAAGFQAGKQIGAIVKTNSTTSLVVRFGEYPSGGASFGTGADSWSAMRSAGWKWRLRIIKGGAAIGFGIVQPGTSAGLVSASGVPGATAGTTVASGYVGELVEQTRTSYSSVTTTNTYGDVTASPISLTAGVWLITGIVSYNIGTSSGQTITNLEAGIGTASGTSSTGLTVGTTHFYSPTAPTSNAETLVVVPSVYVNISSTTSYYLKYRCGYSGGSGAMTVGGRITAVRVA